MINKQVLLVGIFLYTHDCEFCRTCHLAVSLFLVSIEISLYCQLILLAPVTNGPSVVQESHLVSSPHIFSGRLAQLDLSCVDVPLIANQSMFIIFFDSCFHFVDG